jgi:TatD DNase family protein
MALVRKKNLPVIIHCRNAYWELISLLSMKEQRGMRGVVHCFSSTKEEAMALVNMGWHLGFTGTITFKNAPHLREAAAAIPLKRILIETDAPYLTPHPYRGTFPNEPLYVRLIAETLAECKGVTLGKICQMTTENTIRLFRLGESF